MLFLAPWMGTGGVLPPLLMAPLVTMREASVRSKPTHDGGKSLETVAEQYSWNSDYTMPEIHLDSVLPVIRIHKFSCCSQIHAKLYEYQGYRV